MWSSRCSRSPGEERISFPLGQMARGELVRRASGPCKIDHESRSIQIKVNTGPLAFSIASARWRLREYSGGGGGGWEGLSPLHLKTGDIETRVPRCSQ